MGVFICQGCGTEQAQWGGSCPSCGNTETIRLQAAADGLVGKVIKGKYKVERKLGQGGMGAVYLAEQVGIGHKLALKFLKSEFSTDLEICRRFLNEAKSYGRVAHPNAVSFHDFGQDDAGNLFIAMEYCEGIDLKKTLAEKKRLSLGDALEVVLQAADVLAHAHSKGVVHRDLKPENIMLRPGMRGLHIKILDFGIARLMNEGTKLTIAGSIAGTPRYMAPEQVEGKEVDHRADIYSLGIVLYECLTGVQPFDGSTIGEILRKQVVQPMPLLKDHAPDLEIQDLDEVLQRACAKSRDERFADMAEFAAALAPFMPTQQLRIPTGIMNQVTPASGGVPVVRADATGLQQGSDLGTVSGGASLLGRPLDGRASEEVEPIQLKKSRAPLIVGGVLAAGVGLGLVALLAGGSSGAAKVDPPPKVDPHRLDAITGQTTPKPDEPMMPVRVVVNEFELAKAQQNLTQGSTEFANGNLDAARTYFTSVPEAAPQGVEAQGMVKKIDEIVSLTQKAQGLRAGGRCPEAIPLYRAALKLNGKAKDAATGLSFCENSLVPGRME